ncbi:MAG: glycosyltransferase family 39 protein [Thermoanaerobaculia bacterium]
MESIRPPGLPAVAAVSTAGRVPALALAGFGLLVLVRALTLPGSLWEFDEMLFALSLERFEPWAYHPHPPGYPLLVGLGNLFEIAFRDPFRSLVALSFVSSLVSYPALVSAFRRIAGSGQVAVAGALLFLLSPVMLVQGPLPMSDPPSLMFLCLALAAAAGLAAAAEDGGAGAAIALGACASAAVGCRPQHAVAVIPMLVVALWRVPRRRRAETLAAFTLVSLLWLVPLVRATGGPRGFLDYQVKQAAQVAEHDATASRKGRDPIAVASRFVLNGWGPRWLALPVLGLAIAGTVRLRRRRARLALPLAVLSLTHLLFCLGAMDPGDGARYALPFLLGMAFAAAVGCEAAAERARRPGLGWIPAGAVVAVSILYTSPVLAARASPSPPVQAAEWATRHLRPGAILLVSPEMEPHAGYLLRRFKRAPVEEGLRYAARHPKAAVYLLAEGESGWEGAQTFRWPDSKAYHRVTRNHYRVVSLSPVPASRRFQIVRGVSGWGPDGDVRRAMWRWMDADAAIRIFPRRARAAFVTLGLERSGPSPVTVEISVNGAPAARVEIAHGVQRRVEVALPAAKAVEIAFRSNGSPLQLFTVELAGR